MEKVVPCGFEPQTLRLLTVRSKRESRRKLVAAGGRVVHRKGLPKDGCPKPFTLDFPECVSNQKSCCPRMRFQPKELLSQNASPTTELLAVKVVRATPAENLSQQRIELPRTRTWNLRLRRPTPKRRADGLAARPVAQGTLQEPPMGIESMTIRLRSACSTN